MKNSYDVIIIGAGIGGLVSGCYLAKNGLKILLVEKKNKPGGFCSSFRIKQFHFDSCVHSLGDLSPRGFFFSILNELNVFEKLNLIRHNPTDIVTAPHYKIVFSNNLNNTIGSIARAFPREKDNFKRFLDLILEKDSLKNIIKLRNRTFLEILNIFFKDSYLKKILALPTLGNVGVPAQFLNAFTAIKHYKSFLIDGGYYPKSGIQDLADNLLDGFIKFGGDYIACKNVKKIFTRNCIAEGIELNDNSVYKSTYVISACDSRHTFFDLIGRNNLKKEIVNKIDRMIPSFSLFIVYLGLKKDSPLSFMSNCNCWYLFDYEYDLNNYYGFKNHVSNLEIKWIMLLPDYVKRTCLVFTSAPFVSREFWTINRNSFMSSILQKLEEKIPNARLMVELKTSATPFSLQNWTMNYKGSPYGWAYTTTQFMDLDFVRDNIVKNLFLSSHWSTISSGVSGVAIVGKKTAELIIARIRRRR